MSVAFATIKAGDRLYDVRPADRRSRMFGDKWATWTLEVLEVDPEKSRALISWNTTNKPEWKPASYFAQPNIRRKLPTEKRSADRG